MYLNFNDHKQLQKDIENLVPVKGVCIFIDICKSTAEKQKSLKEWVIFIGNMLNLCSGTSLLFAQNIIKLIGDDIMIYIPNEKISAANE